MLGARCIASRLYPDNVTINLHTRADQVGPEKLPGTLGQLYQHSSKLPINSFGNDPTARSRRPHHVNWLPTYHESGPDAHPSLSYLSQRLVTTDRLRCGCITGPLWSDIAYRHRAPGLKYRAAPDPACRGCITCPLWQIITYLMLIQIKEANQR